MDSNKEDDRMPYNVDGDFGQVRLVSVMPTPLARSAMNYTPAAGWHRCNDLYRISRDIGIDTFLLFVTVAGCGHLRLDGDLHLLPAGTAGIIPPKMATEYFVPTGGSWEFYWIHIDGPLVRSILGHLLTAYGPAFAIHSGLPGLIDHFEAIIRTKNLAGTRSDIHISQEIASIMHALLAGSFETNYKGRSGADPVDALIRHIEAHFADHTNIEELSSDLFVNTAHLTRIFKSRTGYSPYEYLIRYRIMKARELLQFTDLSIKDIAGRTGFAQVSNFIHQFKRLESVTPGNYRRG